MDLAKYIKTEDNQIIVFSPLMSHSRFRNFNPVSAGFIQFSCTSEGEARCICAGESITLGISSDREADTKLALEQIMDYGYYI